MKNSSNFSYVHSKEKISMLICCGLYIIIGVIVAVISNLQVVAAKEGEFAYLVTIYALEGILGLLVGALIWNNLVYGNTVKLNIISFILRIMVPLIFILAPLMYFYGKYIPTLYLDILVPLARNKEVITIASGALLGSEVLRLIKNYKEC